MIKLKNFTETVEVFVRAFIKRFWAKNIKNFLDF